MKNEKTKDLTAQGAENQEEKFHGYEWLWDENANIKLGMGDKSVIYALSDYYGVDDLMEDINEDFPNGYNVVSVVGVPEELLGDDRIPTEGYWDIINEVRTNFDNKVLQQAFSIYLSNNIVKPGDILSYIDSFRDDFFGKFETKGECAKMVLCDGGFFERIADSCVRNIVLDCFDFSKYYDGYLSRQVWEEDGFYFWR